ncbi:ABC transporter ATP-binding protein [Erysipelothrix rhusiopathiae SY1027]|uniref:ATP-binding cassette domain-containing protein n=1 Tax=Erysipelothrix rhusiopathiae TaxID=1648 RepID=UPI0003348217|nr:ATP-binding cassette domain-containing protein [Erysipelothrix rhusiopathiae]AGN24339.1 ABC transporter ATP-binding protein [Erysipelothrix rhusiopathiae SY1027]
MKLEIKNLSKSFDHQDVLKDINLTLEKGKIYALLGRNGAGKTTFFNCISQEIPRDSGIACFDDGSLLTQHDVGFVYTNPMLPEFLTGIEFLTFLLIFIKIKVLYARMFMHILIRFNLTKMIAIN